MQKKNYNLALRLISLTVTKAAILKSLSELTKKLLSAAQNKNIPESTRKPVMLICEKIDFLQFVLNDLMVATRLGLNYDSKMVCCPYSDPYFITKPSDSFYNCCSTLTTAVHAMVAEILKSLVEYKYADVENVIGIHFCNDLQEILLQLESNTKHSISVHKSMVQKEDD
jgi:hypothetical protein